MYHCMNCVVVCVHVMYVYNIWFCESESENSEMQNTVV